MTSARMRRRFRLIRPVLDPSIAPATGTPESGGWTTRELKRFIKGLEGINLVGADVVEVSPPYDTVAGAFIASYSKAPYADPGQKRRA